MGGTIGTMPAVRHVWLLILLSACTSDAGDVGAPSSVALGASRLVIGGPTWSAPPGGDGPSHVTAAWERADGTVDAIDVDAPIVRALQHEDGAAILDAERRLWLVARDSEDRELVARDVVTVAGDGRTLVYVVVPEHRGVVHVRDATRDVVASGEMGSAGAFRFVNETRVEFAGAARGGIAGDWVIDLSTAQPRAACLTNCALRAGRPPVVP